MNWGLLGPRCLVMEGVAGRLKTSPSPNCVTTPKSVVPKKSVVIDRREPLKKIQTLGNAAGAPLVGTGLWLTTKTAPRVLPRQIWWFCGEEYGVRIIRRNPKSGERRSSAAIGVGGVAVP